MNNSTEPKTEIEAQSETVHASQQGTQPESIAQSINYELFNMLYNRFLVKWRMRLRLYNMGIAATLVAIFNFSISLCIRVTMPGPFVFNHIFFLLQYKFLAKIIGHTKKICNFRF